MIRAGRRPHVRRKARFGLRGNRLGSGPGSAARRIGVSSLSVHPGALGRVRQSIRNSSGARSKRSPVRRWAPRVPPRFSPCSANQTRDRTDPATMRRGVNVCQRGAPRLCGSASAAPGVEVGELARRDPFGRLEVFAGEIGHRQQRRLRDVGGIRGSRLLPSRRTGEWSSTRRRSARRAASMKDHTAGRMEPYVDAWANCGAFSTRPSMHGIRKRGACSIVCTRCSEETRPRPLPGAKVVGGPRRLRHLRVDLDALAIESASFFFLSRR